MKLVEFDAGAGPRSGLVRKTFVVDLHQANGYLPRELDAILASPAFLGMVRGFEQSCPSRDVLRRRSEVKVLREIDA